jgi:NAD(P)-dependent dehydrogenase (short-subunit alcohol dehydrogenase family)
MIPVGHVAEAGEVAACVSWLLSDEARYVTGQDLIVDGGVSVSASVNEGDVAATWRRAEKPG